MNRISLDGLSVNLNAQHIPFVISLWAGDSKPLDSFPVQKKVTLKVFADPIFSVLLIEQPFFIRGSYSH